MNALQPSRYILQKAIKLGQKMALRDRRIRPWLDTAYQYPTYDLFRMAHRHQLEQQSAFVIWDDKLQELIDRETRGRRFALDNPQMWDQFYTHVAGPIRHAFWYGWEQVKQLQQLYRFRTEEYEASLRARAVVLHIYKRSAEAQAAAQQAQWDGVAEKLFDEMKENDDAFWELPSPQSAGQKQIS